MIDFRYHLVSITAVLLALGLGVILGSAVLGGPFLDQLEQQLEDLDRRNGELRADITELSAEVRRAEGFERAIEPHLLTGSLQGRRVVLIQFDGTAAELVDSTRDAIERSEGEISAVLTLTDKLSLVDEVAQDQLALAVQSSASSPEQLAADAAGALAQSLAAAAGSPEAPRPGILPAAELLQDLEQADFTAVESERDEVVPRGASFVVLGGAAEAAPLDAAGFAIPLVEELGELGAQVLVAEASDSAWGLLVAIRDDAESREVASSVDHAETPMGRIALVLTLASREREDTGHYGVGDGATDLLPEPSPRA